MAEKIKKQYLLIRILQHAKYYKTILLNGLYSNTT